ncbi:MAG: hypothetical protein GY842_00015 [bacterium]|nr:hypothetical protein [bacterium]
MKAGKLHWLNAGDTEYTADTIFLYIGYTFESIERTLSQIYCDRTGDCADNLLLMSDVFADDFESGDTSRWSETIVE